MHSIIILGRDLTHMRSLPLYQKTHHKEPIHMQCCALAQIEKRMNVFFGVNNDVNGRTLRQNACRAWCWFYVIPESMKGTSGQV